MAGRHALLIALLAWTCSATSRPKGHKALAKKAAPNFNKGLAKNAGAASAIAEELVRKLTTKKEVPKEVSLEVISTVV